MLDTRFPRLPGDVGHPAAFSPPARRVVVPNAWPDAVVAPAEQLAASPLCDAFIEALRGLEQAGAAAVTTSCGFLVLLQARLQACVRVPVVTSSLLQLPALLAQAPRVGVLTIRADRLGAAHLRAAGVPEERLGDVVVEGTDPRGEFAGRILANDGSLDAVRAQADVVAAARRLRERAPGVRTVVLECTNMPPYARAVARATGFAVRTLFDDPALAPWSPGPR